MKIVIPSDNPALALECINSIARLDNEQLKNICIVTGDVDTMYPLSVLYDVAVMQRPDPFVYAQAINTAIRFGGPDDYFLLNDDCTLATKNGLSLIAQLAQYKELGVVSAGLKGIGGSLLQQVQTTGVLRLVNGTVSFAAVLLPQHAIEKVGMLDEDFVFYGHEDVMWCDLARDAGLQIGVFDGCVIRHERVSSTFGDKGAFSDNHLAGELLYWRKRAGELRRNPVIVLGPSRSGASVVSHALGAMGVDMVDQAPAHSPSSSAYYRDDDLADMLSAGEVGSALYGYRRDGAAGEKAWGTRIWPSVDAVKLFLSQQNNPLVIAVYRDELALVASYGMSTGHNHEFSERRIRQELSDFSACIEWCADQGIQVLPVSYDDLIFFPAVLLAEIADYVGWKESTAGAEQRINQNLFHFDYDGSLHEWELPESWGKIAVGVRINKHPEAQSFAAITALAHQGMRPGDEWLYPSIHAPTHFAATNLIRSFLQTHCDSLLLIDDDMVFNPDTLHKMRDNKANWRYDIVSAFATQRVQPPRAIVLRKGEQPSHPDSTNGTYYSMLVDEVANGTVMQVDATGLAFTLIRREVIEALTNADGPQFTHYVTWGQNGEGEDVNFCRRAGSLGFTTAVDVSCHVGHIGANVTGWDEFDSWRNNGRTGPSRETQQIIELVGQALPHVDPSLGQNGIGLMKNALVIEGKRYV